MGQQQLLLLVLGIVIVGLAVVVGIQAFGENQKKANADAMVNDGVRLASDAQAWALKPQAFGGGAGDFHKGAATTGALVTLADLGYSTSPYTNLNAQGTATGAGYTITASGSGILITGINTSPANTVHVRACGTTPNSITTVVNGTAPTTCP